MKKIINYSLFFLSLLLPLTIYYNVKSVSAENTLSDTLSDTDSTPTPTPTPTITITPTPTLTPTPTVTSSPSSGSSSSSSSQPSSPSCGNSKPISVPDLFQINVAYSYAKLYFTPLADTNQYYIGFSTDPLAEAYGEQITLLRQGIQSHTVYLLKPNTFYYFKVRGQNGCMPGDWSNIVKVKTGFGRQGDVVNYYKYLGFTSKKMTPVSPKTTSIKTVADQPIIQSEPSADKATPPSSKKCFLFWCF